jgi:hypothetical protein
VMRRSPAWFVRGSGSIKLIYYFEWLLVAVTSIGQCNT